MESSSSIEQNLFNSLVDDLQEWLGGLFGASINIYSIGSEGGVRPIHSHCRTLPSMHFCTCLRSNLRIDGVSLCSLRTSEDLSDYFASNHSDLPVWLRCYAGLSYIAVPVGFIGDPETTGDAVVLTIGNFRDRQTPSVEQIASSVIDYATEHGVLPGDNRENLANTVDACLSKNIQNVRMVDDCFKQNAIETLLPLMPALDIVRRRILDRQKVAEGERLAGDLGLDRYKIGITRQELWENVEYALKQVCARYGFSTCTVYACSEANYSELSKVVQFERNGEHSGHNRDSVSTATELVMASYDEFNSIVIDGPLLLQTGTTNRESRGIPWMNCERFFGARQALVFANETSTGHTVVVGFGGDPMRTTAAHKDAVLRDILHRKVFPYIESALFGIELDYLMSETGHLLGRTHGKIDKARQRISASFRQDSLRLLLDSKTEQALWWMSDGAIRLDIIRNNLYSFASTRTGQNKNAAGDRIKRLQSNLGLCIGESQPSEHNLTIAVNSLKDFAVRSITDAGREITWLVGDRPVLIDCSEDRMSRLLLVLLNLVDNARKFSYRGTKVTVSLTNSDELALFSIVNIGVGVAPDEVSSGRVFRRFARSRYRDRKKRIEGLGLGLAFCRKVVEDELGGQIGLSSKPTRSGDAVRFEGDGWETTVYFKLPLAK